MGDWPETDRPGRTPGGPLTGQRGQKNTDPKTPGAWRKKKKGGECHGRARGIYSAVESAKRQSWRGTVVGGSEVNGGIVSTVAPDPRRKEGRNLTQGKEEERRGVRGRRDRGKTHGDGGGGG